LIFRLGLLLECFLTSEERHGGEHDSDEESESYGPKHDPLASRSGFAAGNDVFGLQLRGLAFFLDASFRQPPLGCSQIITAQNKTVVIAFVFPFDCACEQTGMGVDPIKIGIERAD
jgi:hypothetical protein